MTLSRNQTAWKASKGEAIVGVVIEVNKKTSTVDVKLASANYQPGRIMSAAKEKRLDRAIVNLMNHRAEKLSVEEKTEARKTARQVEEDKKKAIASAAAEKIRQRELDKHNRAIASARNQEIKRGRRRPTPGDSRSAQEFEVQRQRDIAIGQSIHETNMAYWTSVESGPAKVKPDKVVLPKKVSHPQPTKIRHLELQD